MKAIKVLSWFENSYIKRLLKKIENNFNIQYKDTTDFGLKQNDFAWLLQAYEPDVIVLHDKTSRNLPVDIPENVKVLVYCDHSYEQLCIFGDTFFKWLPRNNYLLYPMLDMHNLDKDMVFIKRKEELKNRVFAVPFMPLLDEAEYCSDKDYSCDISIMLSYKKIDYYYWNFGINANTFPGKMLMQFLSELVLVVKNMLKQNETAYMEDHTILHIVKITAEKLQIEQYVSNYDKFLEYWFNAVKYGIIYTEYAKQIVEWLLDGGYNIKIYGAGWKENPKFEKCAFGEIVYCSSEIRKAYLNSKISIGTGVSMGLHSRVFEAMENDCLCLQAEACQKWMLSDWRHYFQDGKEIVIFHNKRELYQKADYFLSHDDERRKIVNAAREKIKTCPDLVELVGNIINIIYQDNK